MEPGEIKITKLDVTPPKLISSQSAGNKQKTLKTFPRGIMKTVSKIKPNANPTKRPTLKKTMKKHTIRLITEESGDQRRKTIRRKLDKLNPQKIREIAVKNGLSSGKAPIGILRQIVEGGMTLGFISPN